jgi:hypothetical protein
MPAKPYRILSLDGGGTWALIQAKALGELYGHDTDGWSILKRFRFAAANSGGSLVLAMLLKGMSPGEILALFRTRRERELIFDRNHVVDRALGGLFGFGSRYNAPGKLAGLLEIFERTSGRWGGDFATLTLDRIAASLNEERRREGLDDFHFLITAFDFDAERSVFFRSDANCAGAAFRAAPCPTIVGALHAATNAPVQYFNRPAEVAFADGSAIHYWDGAIGGYNNPVMAGVLDALAEDGALRERIRVLSIGTGTARLPIVGPDWPGTSPHVIRRKRPRGLDGMRVMSDLRKITAAMMVDRPEAATYMAHVVLAGGPRAQSRVVRLNPILQPRYVGHSANGHPLWEHYEWFAEPSSVRGRALFERLLALDMDATADGEVQDIERLAELWIAGKVPNQPVHADDYLIPQIGHGQFAEALAAWRALDTDPAAPPARRSARTRPAREWARRFGAWWRRLRTRPVAAAAAAAAVAPVAAPVAPLAAPQLGEQRIAATDVATPGAGTDRTLLR